MFPLAIEPREEPEKLAVSPPRQHCHLLVCLGRNSTVICQTRYSPTNARKSYRKKLESKTIAVRPNLDGEIADLKDEAR